MSALARMLTSPLGRKLLMAATGVLLSGFLIAHLAGNLLILGGADSFNHYSHALVSNPLIYLAEAGLLALFVAHFVSGILLYRQNRAARPVAYAVKNPAGHTSHKSLASTAMIFSGLFVLVFVPLHLWHFKFGAYYVVAQEPEVRDLHRLVVEFFSSPANVAFYVAAMVVIGLHLYHGVGSAFQSAGIDYRKGPRQFGQYFALAIAGGFLILPILVYLLLAEGV